MSDSRQVVGQPDVDIRFEQERESFRPHDFLSCEYEIRLEPDQQIQAIESSVIWLTQGKGEEDIGVHYFERRNQNELTAELLGQPQRLSTVLPSTPLTYEGTILKIRWRVRIRLFLVGGKELTYDRAFRLDSQAVNAD